MNCDDRKSLMRKPKSTRERWFEHRDDLAGEHSLGDAGQIFFALLFFGIWITDIPERSAVVFRPFYAKHVACGRCCVD